MKKSMYVALVDANNFFVSCERLFRPDLRNKPVIVLSNNDGCVISRSEEAKAIGFTMGEPYFKVRNLCKKNNVTVFSSNFSLYRDLSRRVMNILQRFSDNVEIYSIDEAFLELDKKDETPRRQAELIRNTVLMEVGIPVSVGVATTKTLAKVAAHFAKPKCGGDGVGVLDKTQDRLSALALLPINDVWGIGFRTTPKLKHLQITTALALTQMPDEWLRKQLTVCGLRTVYELRGIKCFGISEDNSIRKSLLHSESFGTPIYDLSLLSASVASHARKVAEVLRAENVAAREVYVTIRTSRFSKKRHRACSGETLALHSNDSLTIVKTACDVLKCIYEAGVPYTKAGVFVRDIVHEDSVPVRSLFNEESSNKKSLMTELDSIRHRFGDVVRFAVEGRSDKWCARKDMLSPMYTSKWSDVPSINKLNPNV